MHLGPPTPTTPASQAELMRIADIRIDRNGTTVTAQAYIQRNTPVIVKWRTATDGTATTIMEYEEVEHSTRQQRVRTVQDDEVNPSINRTILKKTPAARGMEAPTDDETDDKKPPLTIDQVKETLPDVEVKCRGKIYNAKVRGRRNPFAEVSWDTDCGVMYAEFAWETVTNAINNNKVLKA